MPRSLLALAFAIIIARWPSDAINTILPIELILTLVSQPVRYQRDIGNSPCFVTLLRSRCLLRRMLRIIKHTRAFHESYVTRRQHDAGQHTALLTVLAARTMGSSAISSLLADKWRSLKGFLRTAATSILIHRLVDNGEVKPQFYRILTTLTRWWSRIPLLISNTVFCLFLPLAH